MADRTMLFEELLTEPGLRGKVYELTEHAPARLVCVELTARRGIDWFFARRWVSVGASRRLLYRLVDECERAGYRFAVATGTPGGDAPPQPGRKGPVPRAATFVATLAKDERAIYEELFPDEFRLLGAGYDWDDGHVWKDDRRMEPDTAGRILERADGLLWEWVRVDDEFTWRRYPLERLRTTAATPPGAAGAARAA